MTNNDSSWYNENCFHSNSCSSILKKFHYLSNEAEYLYNEADSIIDKEVLVLVCTAIKSLKRAFEFGSKGEEIENYANSMLGGSQCVNTCNKNSTKCEYIHSKADEKFALETSYLESALNSLNDALTDIKNSIDARKSGYNLIEEYKECVHAHKKI